MNQAQRILDILTLLQKQESLSIQSLADRYETNSRTLQRDFHLLKETLGDKLISPQRGHYALAGRSDLFEYLKKSDLRAFFEFIALFDEEQLKIFDAKEFPIIKAVKRDVKQHYHITDRPIEELTSKHLPAIKEAISATRRATLTYTDRDTITRTYEKVKPIKIVFAEGNWYLAAITQEEQNGGFKFLRINFIEAFELLPESFHRDIEAEEFIKNFQSLFQNYKAPLFEVTLLVDTHIARYFKVKKHLKSQQIIEEKENGDLIMTYQISNDMELLPLVKKWLPHIRILTPTSLANTLQQQLETYLKTSTS